MYIPVPLQSFLMIAVKEPILTTMNMKKYISLMLAAACASAAANTSIFAADEIDTVGDTETSQIRAANEEPEFAGEEEVDVTSKSDEMTESINESAPTRKTHSSSKSSSARLNVAASTATAAPSASPTAEPVPTATAETEKTDDESGERAYYVPVAMKNVNGSGKDSMGNPALDGDAYVVEKDGKAEITISLKAVNVSSLHGHLLKMWCYKTDIYGDMDECVITETSEDAGLDNKTVGVFPSKVTIKRDKTREEKVYIRISVDAMAGFDQDAILELDYANAKETEILSTPTPSAETTIAPTIAPSAEPSTEPSVSPSAEPSPEPSVSPTVEPSSEPSASPTASPTAKPDETSGGSEKVDKNNYLVDIAFWHEVSNQESMGNCALENNPQALVRSNGIVQIATNPVEVSGYKSAVTSILYDTTGKGDFEPMTAKVKEEMSTGTEYDGINHTVTYIALASFALPSYIECEDVEYIDIKMRVPYTPMEDSDSLDENGYMSARLKINWKTKTVTDLTELKSDSSMGSGSVSGSLLRKSDDEDEETAATAAPDGTISETVLEDGTTVPAAEEEPIPYFSDIEDHPLKSYIETALRKKWFVGFGTDEFKPNYILTRAMAAAVMFRAEGGSDDEIKAFLSDVNSEAWYYGAANWTAHRVMIKYLSGNKFLPNDPVTREEAAWMLYRAAADKAPTLEGADVSVFADGADVSTDYARAVGWCVTAGILEANDENKIEPKKKVTRAEMAQLLVKYYSSEKKWMK